MNFVDCSRYPFIGSCDIKIEPELSSLDAIDEETCAKIFSTSLLRCRLCLQSPAYMRNLSPVEWHESGLPELFEKITSIPMEFSDDYSRNICAKCERDLHLAEKIMNDFIRVEKLWKIYLEKLRNAPGPIGTVDDLEAKSESVHVNDTAENGLIEMKHSPEEDEINNFEREVVMTAFEDESFLKDDSKKDLPINVHRNMQGDPFIVKTKKTKKIVKPTLHTQSSHICGACKLDFNTNSDLQIHRTLCLPSWRHQCHWCDEKIRGSGLLQKHVRQYHPNVPWPECAVCERRFVHKQYLRNHFRSCHMTSTQRHCPYCDKVFHLRCNFENHVRTHTGEKPFMCEICGKSFGAVTACQVHIKSHSTSNRLSVTKPSKPRQNPNDSLVRCELCNYSTRHMNTLHGHMKRKHGPEGSKLFNNLRKLYCIKCHIFLETIDERKAHMLGHLEYECDYCTARFSNCDAVQFHMRIHKNKHNRPHPCEICKKSFASQLHLRKHHQNVHEKEKQFKCSHCSKEYRQRYELVSHVNAEHLNRRKIYKCNLCEKQLQSWIGLRRHCIAQHNDSSHQMCSLCSQSFKTADLLRKHHEIEHAHLI